MRSISSIKRSSVISLLQQGYSLRQIESRTGVGKSTIGRIKKEEEVDEEDKENNKGGRPSKLSDHDKRSIIRQIATGQLDNAVEATQFINPTLSDPVTAETVRNVLKNNNFQSVVKKKCPLLKRAHRQEHLKFARYHENWTVEDWKRILWSDETKINRIGSDGRTYTWKMKGEPLSDRITTPTVKHGGGNNLMVWGSMAWGGVGVLSEVQGIMNADQYCDILDGGVVESFEKLEIPEEERMFQQDNDPKHTSKKATQWFEDNDIDVMVWPAQSPDLNPIEHLWVDLKKSLKKYPRPAKGVHELWERVVVEWNKIPPGTCENLVESMPRRVQAVIKAKGGHTKY